LTADHPVRIELFDTDVDSLRIFDEGDQRSMDNVDTVTIPPASDLIVPAEQLKQGGGPIAKTNDGRLREGRAICAGCAAG
jgi:transcription-repair coupling factor (superfamily II helicase)